MICRALSSLGFYRTTRTLGLSSKVSSQLSQVLVSGVFGMGVLMIMLTGIEREEMMKMVGDNYYTLNPKQSYLTKTYYLTGQVWPYKMVAAHGPA